MPIGAGTVDFRPIIESLLGVSYQGTMTLEMKPEFQEVGRIRVGVLIKEIQENGHYPWEIVPGCV
ncbi:MAG: hypothetical protein V1897_03510 [Pseudomonadota bacterium]